MEDLKVKYLEAEVITLKHPEGDSVITLQATKDGAGIWIDKNGKSSKELICIYTINGQTCVGLYGKGEKRAVNLGLCVDDDGEPFVQVSKTDGSFVHISADALMAMGK